MAFDHLEDSLYFVTFRRDHIEHEADAAKRWPNNWSFLATDYKEVT